MSHAIDAPTTDAGTIELRELELELIIDASAYGHTDHVHRIACEAAGDERAATLILEALDTAGHLVPEGATVTQQWRVVAGGERVTEPMDVEEFTRWVQLNGLADDHEIVAIRTIESPIPREATRPTMAPVAADEGAF